MKCCPSRTSFPRHRGMFSCAAVSVSLIITGCAEATPKTPGFVQSQTPAMASHPGTPLVSLPDFTPIIERYGPSVVNISSTSEKALPKIHNPFPPNSPFYHFFQHFPPSTPGHPHHEKIQSLGSGFVVSANGYIVTAAHVVRGARHIVVTLTNHKAYRARIVGLSVRYDTALLKIGASNLPTAPIGNSNHLEVGQWLLAVGAPFGFFNTVTQGVVSAINRPLPDDEYIPFIQSDVPINPGNSGGPLFNMWGQVVGINDQIYTSSGGYMGLSFSIPINTVMKVVDDLRAHRPIQFGYLGVEVQNVTPDMAEALHIKEPVGALVASVVPGSPAARAGLHPGDVIVTYQGKPVYNVGQLPLLVGSTQPGQTVTVGILHKGEAEQVPVTVRALPAPPEGGMASTRPAVPHHALDIPGLNLEARPLPRSVAQKFHVDQGVEVVKVHAGAAEDAGIQPGMIIEQVNQIGIRSPEQLKRLVASLPTRTPIPILLAQGKTSHFIVIRLPGNRQAPRGPGKS